MIPVLASVGWSQTRPSESLPPLTQVAQIRRLTPNEARRRYPINLRGVITYHSPEYRVTFFQDKTAGIFIFDQSNPQISPGTLVEVTGNTTPGEFAPSIEHADIRVLGRAPLPTAAPKPLGELMAGREDSQWVEIRGIVHSAALEDRMPPSMRGGPPQLVLEIASGNNNLKARILVFPPNVDYRRLVDAAVAVRGVCSALVNNRMQFIGVQLLVPGLDQLTLDRAGAVDPYAQPVAAIGSLMQFSAERAFGGRTHIRGVVTLSSPGSVFIQDDSGGVLVKSEQPTIAEPGDLVDAAGFPSSGVYAPVLNHGVFRKLGKGRLPAPRDLTATSLSSSEHDAELVKISGWLLSQSVSGNYDILTMELDGHTFTGRFEKKARSEQTSSLSAGSQLRLTGIWSVRLDEERPVIHQILLRSAADITVIRQAPWITRPRILLILGALFGLFLLTLLWVTILRNRIRVRTETLRAVLESTEDGILAVNAAGRIVTRNHKFNVMWRIQEHLARTASDDTLIRYVAGQLKDPATFLDTVMKTYEEPDATTQDMLEFADGRVFERYSEPQRFKGKSVGRVWGFRDVTKRKEAEARLRSLSAAVEQSPVSIVITNLEGGIEYVNPKFTQVTGYTFEEVLGQNPRVLKSGETTGEHYRELWETIKSGAAWRGTFHNKKKNGELYWESATISAIRDAQGAPTRYLAVKEDITQRRLATEALEVSERRYRGLFDHILEGFCYCQIVSGNGEGVDFVYLAVNSAFETLTGLKDVVGKRVSEVIPGIREHDPMLFESWVRVTQTGKPEKLEMYVESLQRLFSTSLYCPQKGYFISVFDNITERKLAEEALRQSERQRRLAQKLESIGQLAAGIAHEINTPIQYVGDNAKFLEQAFRDLARLLTQQRKIADVLRRSQEPDLSAMLDRILEEVDVDYLLEEAPKAIGQLSEGVEQVARIVRAMKEFSHPGPVEKVLLDINRALGSTILVAKNEWKYVAELTTDFDPELPLVPCVAGEFNQVVLNLIVNASHAIADVTKTTGGKGAIKISTRRSGDWAEVRVSDTGTGIPKAIRAKVFDPFFTTKEVGKGTGQGLSIAHAVIVQKHQGTLRFETETGAGTTFILQLPLEGQFASETSSVCG